MELTISDQYSSLEARMAEDEEQKLIQFPCGQDHWTHSEWEVMRNSIKKKMCKL